MITLVGFDTDALRCFDLFRQKRVASLAVEQELKTSDSGSRHLKFLDPAPERFGPLIEN